MQSMGSFGGSRTALQGDTSGSGDDTCITVIEAMPLNAMQATEAVTAVRHFLIMFRKIQTNEKENFFLSSSMESRVFKPASPKKQTKLKVY